MTKRFFIFASHMMKIGNISFDKVPLLLAPMEDITDMPFRTICKRLGADLVYTEFISSEGLIRDASKSLVKLDINPLERPVGIQLFGHDIDSMVLAARYAEKAQPEIIDLNFGCPVKKVVRKGGGSAMLQTPDIMVEMTRQIVKAVNIPVTVKTRLGWDHNSMIIYDLAERLQDTGIAALSIHGRTRSQLYKGEADWTLIGEIKQNPNMEIPIIGNGDITSAQKAKHYLDTYQPDGLMVGRAAIGNPWIFGQIRHFLDTGEEIPLPTTEDRRDVCLEHLSSEILFKGERQAVIEMRKAYSGYFKGVENFKPYKAKLMTALSLTEVEDILTQFITFQK